MAADVRDRPGRFGVWHRGTPRAGLAPALEGLGFGALWLGGSPSGDLEEVQELLDADHHAHPRHGHREHLDGRPAPPRPRLRPGRGRAPRPVPARGRRRAPGGDAGVPLALRVAVGVRGRAAGRRRPGRPAGARRPRRGVLGAAVLLAPEQKVVVDADPTRARTLGRESLDHYLGLANYRNNLLRLGWSEADLADGGSDALVAHGPADQVAARLRAHLDARADHVAVHLLVREDEDRVETFTVLADALGLPRVR